MSDETPEPKPTGIRRVWAIARPWIAVLAFLAGFLWDSLTLRRIDRLSDNLLLLAYLLFLGLFLVLEIRIAAGRLPRLERVRGWVTWLAQFGFGGLYSAYVVFYFKSASFGRSFLFLGLLAGLMVANEFLEERLKAERLRVGLYWLCAFSFLLFFVPVVTGFPGPGLLIIAAIGASILGLGVTVLGWVGHASLRRTLLENTGMFAALALFLAFLSWMNIIPPVPFALMDVGIYHKVARNGPVYELTYESPPWYRPFRNDDRTFHHRNDAILCFTAVFAPSGMETSIRHVWERYDPAKGWVQTMDYAMKVKGGRDGGYRGWSQKSRGIVPGDWRVRVLTATGAELAVYRFEVDDGTELARRPDVVRVYE